MRVVPALDKLEDGHLGFGLSLEALAVEQFAFEGGKEAFTHRGFKQGGHRETVGDVEGGVWDQSDTVTR